MTAKEKAQELFDNYAFVEIPYYSSKFEIKQCALIAINEILFLAQWADESIYKYWQEVEQEIEKL